MDAMKFLVADDHPLFQDALSMALSQGFSGCEIAKTDGLASTINHLKQDDDLDLLLLDLNMPGSHGFYGLIQVREKFPDVPVVVISASEDNEVIARTLALGASGFIPKSTSGNEMAKAISEVLEGEQWVPADFTMPQQSQEDIELAARINDLTEQQFNVLIELKEGHLNKQIAFGMEISEATVKAHVTAILRKLGVNNRTQAVILASKLDIDTSIS